jgi:hypothetical protein
MTDHITKTRQALDGLDFDGMHEAFHRVIEAHASSSSPFHNPVNADASVALRELHYAIPAIAAQEGGRDG